MTVHKIFPQGFASNSYLLTADGKRAVAIDPAQPRISDEAKKRGLEIRYVLLTHGHFDHIGGCAALQEAGAEIGCMEIEKPLVLGKDNMGEKFGVTVPPFRIDFTFRGGETFRSCGIELQVIATPGHTAGSVCFLSGDKLFTGDTLFEGTVGRTDLPTGSASALIGSVRGLYALKGDCIVFAGHGGETTLEHERRYNKW